jgi:hypothetical protein
MTGTVERHRPVGVTILVVLLWIQAVLQVIGGLVLIFARNDDDILGQASLSSSEMLWLGIGAIIIGLITALIANAVGRGSGFARGVVAFFAILNLITGIVEIFSISGHLIASGLMTILVAVVVLYILFGERGSREFFEGSAAR